MPNNPRPSIPLLDPRQRYTIPETSALLRQCRATTYKDINAGRLEAFKAGRRTYVTGRSIVARSAPPGADHDHAA